MLSFYRFYALTGLAMHAIFRQSPRSAINFAKRFHTLFMLLLLLSTSVSARTFDYIYIDASEGNASGGHTALRFGEDVFHYQYFDGGFIRVIKQQAVDFEFAYRFLGNRTLYLSQIEVSDETYAMLRDYFILQTHQQKQQFSLLASLRRDRSLLNWFKNFGDTRQEATQQERFFLAGAGLFYKEADFAVPDQTHIESRKKSAVLIHLQKAIEMSYGTEFLDRRTEELRNQIKQLSPVEGQRYLGLNQEHLPATGYSFADHYLDLVTGYLALKVLQDSRELDAYAYVFSDLSVFELTAKEIETLRLFSKKLQKSILQLLKSNRPDWGYALLVSSARLITVNKSIKSGRLALLDVFGQGKDVIGLDAIQKYAQELQIIASQALEEFQKNSRALQNKQTFTERDYSYLEMAGNRYLELRNGLDYKKNIRFNGVNLLPTKNVALPELIIPVISGPEIDHALSKIDAIEKQFYAQLQRAYGYNLITRNCVTELFKTVEAALIQKITGNTKEAATKESIKAESVRRLGGFVDSSGIGFIPFISFHAVQNQYNVIASRRLASFRLNQLEQLYRQENDVLVSLRETNTMSSTLYKWNPKDSFFIFFTDKAWPLRPLFGAVNTLAGVGETLAGLLFFPFDAGTTLKSGTMGILMSLPELVFVNMRKGSYQYLPYAQLSSKNGLIFHERTP
jgi:hypothetical protein